MNSMASKLDTMTGIAPGQKQFGKYYLQELLNNGGMAEIWLVTDGRSRPFALRKLRNELRFNFLARRRFQHGCRVLSRINESDFIVGYVEHGKAEGVPYLVMDYVEAANLKELFGRHDPILLENVAQILIDMAVGLRHVHESGYMHLDFKPENMLVTGTAMCGSSTLTWPSRFRRSRRKCRRIPARPPTWRRNNCSGSRLIRARTFLPMGSPLMNC